MKKFFQENKIFLAVIVGAVIVGTAVYFGLSGKEEAAPTECLAPSETMVTKIIDGDTVVVEGGYHVRLLGIDADERGYPCYDEAKSRLEELVLNKEVRLEIDQTDVDQYDRCLRYIFLDGQNIDLQLVKEGLAISRFYEPDVKYRDEITEAEKEAIENKVGCKWGETKTIPLSPSVKFKNLTPEETDLEVVFACNAGNYIGKEKIVEGKIVGTYRSKTNTVFLNFEKAYPNHCFTGVIFSSDLYKFVQNPEDYYLNKTVRIMGEVKEYQGKPEIILETPNQIEIGK